MNDHEPEAIDTENAEDETRIKKSELARMLSGEIPPPAKNRRLLVGILAGILVGFVESGMPRDKAGIYRAGIYIGLRVLTGMACAWVPWRTHAMTRGIAFGLLFGIPIFFTYGRDNLLISILLALVAGLLIGTWTERFGIPSHIDRTDDEKQAS